jgi:hypothetical protein
MAEQVAAIECGPAMQALTQKQQCGGAEDGRSAMTQARRDLILHRPERAIAEEFGMSLEEVQQVLDSHPVEVDRNGYLRRCLAQQLLMLDRLEVTFGRMAFEDRDTTAGALLVEVAERKATLLGLNAPIGHAVRVVQHPPELGGRLFRLMARSIAAATHRMSASSPPWLTGRSDCAL